MAVLNGKVALVTGGSRNVGRGIALGLGEAGAKVYITGRAISPKVAKEVSALGGEGIAVRCDHQHDDEVQAVFEQIKEEEGKLNILVNNAWGGYERLRRRRAYPGYQWNVVRRCRICHWELMIYLLKSTNPICTASTAAWVRSETANFSMIALTWLRTVPVAKCSCSPI